MTTTLDYLIPYIRMKIGDLDATKYRYLDAWISTALLMAVGELGRWWNYKYLINTLYEVYRNPNIVFLFPEPPVIPPDDEQIITLMASYIILEGSLENSAWNVVSWRDAEISFNANEGARIRNDNLKRLWDELVSLITPPSKKLAYPQKGSLPGYKGNNYERVGNY